jgi:hypothetical protein
VNHHTIRLIDLAEDPALTPEALTVRQQGADGVFAFD